MRRRRIERREQPGADEAVWRERTVELSGGLRSKRFTPKFERVLNLCEIDGAGVDVLRMDRKLRDQETLETVKAPGLCDQIHRSGPFALRLLFGFAGFLGG